MKIIFQNRDFIVVDKPVGMAVHSGIGIKEKTLVDFLISKFPEMKEVGDMPDIRPGIVHRLDRDTSGVMLVARSQKAFEYLKNLFKNRQIEKKYLALVYGKLKNKEGEIEGEMGRSKRDFRKQSFVRGKIHPVKSPTQGRGAQEAQFNGVNVRKARYSLSFYKALKEFGEYSILEVLPKTGRTHQIRVHLHALGHPIVGDKKYTFKEFKRKKYPRMFLHASEIKFTGLDGTAYSFESELPEEFKNFVKEKTL